MHTDGKANHVSWLLMRLSFFPSFRVSCKWRETPTYLPHPGHSYFYADNGRTASFRQPSKHRSPPPFAKTVTHVCALRARTDAVTLYEELGTINGRAYRYPSVLSGFFFPRELLGPEQTPRCYWSTQTQSPAHRNTWPLLSSSLLQLQPANPWLYERIRTKDYIITQIIWNVKVK